MKLGPDSMSYQSLRGFILGVVRFEFNYEGYVYG